MAFRYVVAILTVLHVKDVQCSLAVQLDDFFP